MKKLSELLSREILKDAEVIAGENGLSRLVESVETLENTPDMIKFVTSHSFLLTTGYSYKDDPSKLHELIIELDQSNCAGIGIKLHRFIDEIPEEVIELANKLNFPIISVPNNLTLTKIGHHLLQYLWENKMDDLFSAYKVQKKFTNMMLKGANLQSFVDQLGFLTSYPIILYNPIIHPIHTTREFRSKHMDEVKLQISTTLQEEIDYQVLEEKFSTLKVTVDDKIIPITIYPVQTTHPYPHWLAVLNDEQEVTIPYTVIEQASNVISSILVKNEAVLENERVVKNNFFSSLVDGNIKTQEEVMHRGKNYGLKRNQKYACLVCKLDEEKNANIFEKEVKFNKLTHFIYDLFVNTFSNFGIEHIIFMKNEYFVIILQFPKEFNETLKKSIVSIIKSFQKRMFKDFKTSISFGISNFINDMLELPIAYREAVDAVATGTALNQKQIIKFYRTKELKELMRMIPSESLEDFYKETLRSLAYPKTSEEKDLINTLSVYLDHNCEITETSKILFIHRNTVKYRISKCKKILQYNIEDPDNSLRLRTALLVKSFFTE
ncbi:PucR family transcriptional regulator [Ornithinibacillus halotolerans]|uniref:Purine catabolism regulatory protein n=1 Tax=Ornithinibacillus halotolerans TaxID=1274357 RepID=A0A916W532_9BACI|nr:PucR family transcriptional regulator [Ornithinibacillus halotolerans]GGA66094.1 purine catabolism regulatory protein [Ornithinibacillus halotolerans]